MGGSTFYPGRRDVVSHSAFKYSARPIGSSINVGDLHRVSVRQSPVESASGPVVDDQIRRLEIEITALDIPRAEQGFCPKDSYCSVQ
jgi:hypothetical protein